MIKIEITRQGSKKQREANARKKSYLLKVAQNIQQEIEANPDLIGTRYTCDEDIAFEVMSRVDELLEMEKAADKLKGGWVSQLQYKFSSR